MVKPENAEMAENAIIRSVQQGRTRGRVDERMLRDLLENVGGQTTRKTSVKVRGAVQRNGAAQSGAERWKDK